MPRSKGKIPRINVTPVEPISLTGEDWLRIESAYQAVSATARTQITAATNQFLKLAEAENTGLMSDAIRRVDELRKSAESLVSTIEKDTVPSITREYVDDELATSHVLLTCNSGPLAEKYVSDIFAVLTGFVEACTHARKQFGDMSKFNFWPDGGAWEGWIRQLTGILKAHELPTGVRKDGVLNTSGKASQFVLLVDALQQHIPKTSIRKRLSVEALAEAIGKARRVSKPPVAKKTDRTSGSR